MSNAVAVILDSDLKPVADRVLQCSGKNSIDDITLSDIDSAINQLKRLSIAIKSKLPPEQLAKVSHPRAILTDEERDERRRLRYKSYYAKNREKLLARDRERRKKKKEDQQQKTLETFKLLF